MIKITEYTYLTELGNTCQKFKLYISVIAFKRRKKAFENGFIMLFKPLIRNRFKRRLIIFINEDNYSFTGFFVGGFNYMSESLRLRKLFLIKLITILPLSEMFF